MTFKTKENIRKFGIAAKEEKENTHLLEARISQTQKISKNFKILAENQIKIESQFLYNVTSKL
jgi:hypothetical protein